MVLILWNHNCTSSLDGLDAVYCTEVCFAGFLSGRFINAIVVTLPERKLEKRTSLYWMTTGFRFSLRPLESSLLFAVELPLLRSVVGLPPLRVPFARVRGRHFLSAMAVGRSDKFVFCPIALRNLGGFRVAPPHCTEGGRLDWPVHC